MHRRTYLHGWLQRLFISLHFLLQALSQCFLQSRRQQGGCQLRKAAEPRLSRRGSGHPRPHHASPAMAVGTQGHTTPLPLWPWAPKATTPLLPWLWAPKALPSAPATAGPTLPGFFPSTAPSQCPELPGASDATRKDTWGIVMALTITQQKQRTSVPRKTELASLQSS